MPSKRQKVDPAGLLLRRVDEALAKVQGPGQYHASGAMSEFPNPSICISEGEIVGIPLTESAAKTLIAQCHRSPYGHGEQTLVDTAVRNTWELDATQFTIENPAWATFVERMTRSCCDDLGIDTTTIHVDAKLYKLLVYETGGMFDKHQDSEKEVGMFGTMVVVLPTAFTGGELVVHPPHGKGDAWTWVPSARSLHDVQYAAFYGDCEHEVKAVTSGFRVCLTYKLVTSEVSKVPKLAVSHGAYEELRGALDAFCGEWKDVLQWRNIHESLGDCKASRLVYALHHQYTTRGLDFDLLKGRDRVVAQTLAQYCREKRDAVKLYLCRVRYVQQTDEPFLENRQGRDNNDDAEDDDSDDNNVNIYERNLFLKLPWLEYGGTLRSTMLNRIDELGDEATASFDYEVCPLGFFDRVKLDGEKHIGYMGNEGDCEEQWYKSAALIVQPVYGEWVMLEHESNRHVVAKAWKALIMSRPSDLYTVTEAMFPAGFRYESWSWESKEFQECLRFAVEELKDARVFLEMILSCESTGVIKDVDATIEKIGRMAVVDAMVKRLGEIPSGCALKLVRSTVSSATSADDRARIVDAIPWPQEIGSGNPDDLAGVLQIARAISEGRARRFLVGGGHHHLTACIAPAFAAVWKSSSDRKQWETLKDELVGVVQVSLKVETSDGVKRNLQDTIKSLQALKA